MGNRHIYQIDGNEVAAPQNASEVKSLLADAMAEIRAGKMDPKLGTTLGYLGTSHAEQETLFVLAKIHTSLL